MKSIFITLSILCLIFVVGCNTFQTAYFGVEDEAINTPAAFAETKSVIEKAKKNADSLYADKHIDKAMELGKTASIIYWERYDKEAKKEAESFLALARQAALNSEIIYDQPPPPPISRVNSLPKTPEPPETFSADKPSAEFAAPPIKSEVKETGKSKTTEHDTKKSQTKTQITQKPEAEIKKTPSKVEAQTDVKPKAEKTVIQKPQAEIQKAEPKAEESQTAQTPEVEKQAVQKPEAKKQITQKPEVQKTQSKTETQPVQKPKVEEQAAQKPKTKSQIPAFKQSQNQYAIQVAAFEKSVQAENLINKFVDKGYPAYHQKTEVDGKTWHRVRIGPYSDKETARKEMQKLKNSGLAEKGFLIKEK